MLKVLDEKKEKDDEARLQEAIDKLTEELEKVKKKNKEDKAFIENLEEEIAGFEDTENENEELKTEISGLESQLEDERLKNRYFSEYLNF